MLRGLHCADYTDTKQGAIGAFNHRLGALIVEIDADVFYVRELNADRHGSFIDLDRVHAWGSNRRARSQ